jgi:hypothetical protein
MAARERRGPGTKSLGLPIICRRQVARPEEVSNGYAHRSSMNILKNGKAARPSVNGRQTITYELETVLTKGPMPAFVGPVIEEVANGRIICHHKIQHRSPGKHKAARSTLPVER